MLIGENFLFVGLQKTASTYVVKQLKKYFNQNIIHKPEMIHSSMKVGQEIYGIKKYNLATIRNPFELYVSLFAYGCSKKGSLYIQLSTYSLKGVIWLYKKNRFGAAFRKLLKSIFLIITGTKFNSINGLYSDPYNKDNFKKWVIFINNLNHLSSFDDDVKFGFFTDRFLRIYCDYDTDTKGRVIRKSIKILPNIWIRNEKIDQDLKYFFNKIDPTINYKYDINKVNKSKHLDYDYYYDDELKNYIYKIDEFIFNKFY